MMDLIETQGGFQSVSDDCDRLLRLQDVRDDNFDAFFLSRQFLHLAQVLCYTLNPTPYTLHPTPQPLLDSPLK
jgi:hypothetical protein